LRATIAWSYDLLSEPAARLLGACSVFRGGISLDILETVCAAQDLGAPTLDTLQELVDQSLIRQALPSAGEIEDRDVVLHHTYIIGSITNYCDATLVVLC
jgi:predicted ATPase